MAIGGTGAVSGRPAVTLSGSIAPGRRNLGGSFEQTNDLITRTIADLPPGLRTTRVIHEPGITSEVELSRRAHQSLERPLGASERFRLFVNRLVRWSDLVVGNYVRVIGRLGLATFDRKVRIIGMQPDWENGVCELAVEVSLRP
jgi:hypothetical protein